MNEVELAGTGLVTTRLGFGCGPLLRVGSARERQRLLGAAHEAGIRHFDVARSYGLGAAEGELGRFARGRRAELVIATKFGIDVDRRARRLRAVQGVARRVLAAFPALRGALRRPGAALLEARRYDAAKARESLETSLRELGTDYLDLFLLHEPSLAAVTGSDVIPFLEEARRQGKIRTFGVSGLFEDVVSIAEALPALAPVVQFPSDVFSRNAERPPAAGLPAKVTFSPLSAALGRVVRHASRDAATRRRWGDLVGVDCGSPETLAPLLIRCCLEANPAGVVLFSTTQPRRLRALASAAEAKGSVSALVGRIDGELVG